jgi:hypothetical protein
MDMKPSRFTEEQIIGFCASRRPMRRPPMFAANADQQRNLYKWKAKYHKDPISVGVSTSCRMPWLMDAAFAFWRSSTTSPGNA